MEHLKFFLVTYVILTSSPKNFKNSPSNTKKYPENVFLTLKSHGRLGYHVLTLNSEQLHFDCHRLDFLNSLFVLTSINLAPSMCLDATCPSRTVPNGVDSGTSSHRLFVKRRLSWDPHFGLSSISTCWGGGKVNYFDIEIRFTIININDLDIDLRKCEWGTCHFDRSRHGWPHESFHFGVCSKNWPRTTIDADHKVRWAHAGWVSWAQ